MELVKSKDAAESLNVSQTTVKRWASHFPHYFQKDKFGHYIFTTQDLAMLAFIKEALERGDTMDMIVLPEPEQPNATDSNPATGLIEHEASTANSPGELSEIYFRLEQVEYKLEQKADEVVATQILQHRSELEELRRLVDYLAAAIENAKLPMAAPGGKSAFAAGTAAAEVAAASAMTDSLGPASKPAPSSAAPAPTRKRGLFRSLFVWF
ncbi:MerR family transcriptional regulator [Paenibacillus silvisoli]|uniref:MerR family transcriptional regulator n=1 Tax=Paenibacillus silvisoli TaxID=3110539 RepID=UPI0028050F42|nr:MerR family transcriptional regulator [Paenibacillus silvisoli]